MRNLIKSAIRNKMFNHVSSIKKKPKVNEPGPKAAEKAAGGSSGLTLFQTFYSNKMTDGQSGSDIKILIKSTSYIDFT